MRRRIPTDQPDDRDKGAAPARQIKTSTEKPGDDAPGLKIS